MPPRVPLRAPGSRRFNAARWSFSILGFGIAPLLAAFSLSIPDHSRESVRRDAQSHAQHVMASVERAWTDALHSESAPFELTVTETPLAEVHTGP